MKKRPEATPNQRSLEFDRPVQSAKVTSNNVVGFPADRISSPLERFRENVVKTLVRTRIISPK